MSMTKHKHSFIPEVHGDDVTWVCVAVKGCPEEWEGRPAPAWPEESYADAPPPLTREDVFLVHRPVGVPVEPRPPEPE